MADTCTDINIQTSQIQRFDFGGAWKFDLCTTGFISVIVALMVVM